MRSYNEEVDGYTFPLLFLCAEYSTILLVKVQSRVFTREQCDGSKYMDRKLLCEWFRSMGAYTVKEESSTFWSREFFDGKIENTCC